MYWRRVGITGLLLMNMMLLPEMVAAQSDQMKAGTPSIGQKLVREGDFALKLSVALEVGAPQDEVGAENLLAEVGIMPKNGWIADYPVTPDIIDELYKAVREAAATNRIPLSEEVALNRMNDVMLQVGLSIGTPSSGKVYTEQLPSAQDPPASTIINNYYQSEGPPTVTYYTPPADYYYMYGWVPFPFWSAGLWFPGFFVLNDFHRTVFIDNRAVFVSNHFRDFRRNRIVRVDPATRFHGSAISSTGVIHTRGAVPAVGSGRNRAFLNEPRINSVPNVRTVPQTRSDGIAGNRRNGDSASLSSMRSGRTFSSPLRDDRTISLPARSDVGIATPFRGNSISGSISRNGGFVSAPRRESSFVAPVSSGRSFSMPSRVDRSISMPSRSGGSDRMSFRGNSGSGGRGRR